MSYADVLVIAWECDAHPPFVRCSGLTKALRALRWLISEDWLAPKASEVCLFAIASGCEAGVLLIFHLYSQLSLELSHLQKYLTK